MNKNILYYVLGGNFYFSLLFKLSLISLYFLKAKYRIIVFVDKDFLNILDQSELRNLIDYEVVVISAKSSFESAVNRYSFFDHVDVTGGERVLYCDADILFGGNIDEIFVLVDEKNEICAVNDFGLLMNTPHNLALNRYGFQLFNGAQIRDIKINNVKSINAGQFAFNINAKETFRKILKISAPGHICYEQPYFNYVLYHEKNYNFSLQEFITLKGYKLSENNEVSSKPIVHFCGGAGSAVFKFSQMFHYMDLMLKDNKEYESLKLIVSKNYERLSKEYGDIFDKKAWPILSSEDFPEDASAKEIYLKKGLWFLFE